MRYRCSGVMSVKGGLRKIVIPQLRTLGIVGLAIPRYDARPAPGRRIRHQPQADLPHQMSISFMSSYGQSFVEIIDTILFSSVARFFCRQRSIFKMDKRLAVFLDCSSFSSLGKLPLIEPSRVLSQMRTTPPLPAHTLPIFMR